MNDTERPHHSHGVCLSCGGKVDASGMSEGGDVELPDGAEDSSGGPVGADSEELAAQNARDFARAVNGGR